MNLISITIQFRILQLLITSLKRYHLYLTKAIERFVLSYYSGHNKIKQSFELTEKGRKDLSELIRYVNISALSGDQNGAFRNGTYFDLPQDFMFTIQENVIVSSDDPCLEGARLFVKPVTYDQYNANIENPFKNPNEKVVWRIDDSEGNTGFKRHQLVTANDYAISNYELRYLKYPTQVVYDPDTPANNVDCELNEITHRRIVDMAVEIAIEITKDNRLQTNLLMNQRNE